MKAGQGMDFRSALYLGLRHRAGPGDGWPAWRALTLGKPAALQDPPGARGLARELAQLQGCEAATLLPSTLHLYRDLFGMLAAGYGAAALRSSAWRSPACARPEDAPASAARRYALLVDAAAYPIARWGVECAASRGMPVVRFRHGDSAALARLAQALWRQGWATVVLADGYTPGDARPPPLRAYADIVANRGGWLVLDDTQALGILGPGGGGSVRLHGLQGAPVLAGASLAKGFGAPLAVLAGPAQAIQRFEQCSETRVHTSPPSVAVIAAARQALRINARHGARLRRLLAARIAQLRQALAALGLACHGGAFPVQVVPLPERVRSQPQLADALADRLQALLLQTRDGPALGLLLRADHGEQEVARAAELLANAIGGEP
jgi:8-amino-7-oxononanoate synthase